MMLGGGSGGMGAPSRVPTWRERENNRRRERRRRAIAAKIFSGLRAQGNYTLPKHCDNNEVLKALADEAGWTVEPDGTTYRKGCKPLLAVRTGPPTPSPCSSQQVSPRASFRSSGSSHITLGGGGGSGSGGYFGGMDGGSLVPWLTNLSSGPSFASSSKYSYFDGGSMSAPVTSPSGSPPRMPLPSFNTGWGVYPVKAVPPRQYDYSMPNSRPSSPRVAPDPNWLSGFSISSTGPSSPAYNLIAHRPNPFGTATAPSTRVHTPALSGAGSPVAEGDGPMGYSAAEGGFQFGSDEGLLNAWHGERVEEEPDEDELELRLTLGRKKYRGAAAGAADNA
ncbi:hypothetical protein QYE76_021842 [Lolium multiflorum]|uniref:Protein BZR1 homolog n=1 Tax=Lolium multiflorum TaxID=4521 RepID=A0AAD8VT94_LOLMU|nr:hypothetical protein QYE76_059264 [Lolium multiflorum]KAK1616325.1 hypothetical protein QYE76_021842 [Lolium multiflorum]